MLQRRPRKLSTCQKLTVEAEANKKQLEADLMADTAPAALKKLRSKCMVFNSIIVKELLSIAYVYYPHQYGEMPQQGNKQAKVDKLAALYAGNKNNLDSIQLE